MTGGFEPLNVNPVDTNNLFSAVVVVLCAIIVAVFYMSSANVIVANTNIELNGSSGIWSCSKILRTCQSHYWSLGIFRRRLCWEPGSIALRNLFRFLDFDCRLTSRYNEYISSYTRLLPKQIYESSAHLKSF